VEQDCDSNFAGNNSTINMLGYRVRFKMLSKRLVAFLGKGGGGVLEQGVFSGTNFLISILLARWLLPQEYGLFALIYSAMFFGLLVQTVFFVEPMYIICQQN